jgi:uncharacterized protein YbbC (DUF1343 family)
MKRRAFIQRFPFVVSAAALTSALSARTPLPPPQARVLPGVDVLAEEGFAKIRGQRVGLLTHPAGVNRFGEKTIDVLRRAPGARLTKLFGPEHGVDGKAAADVPIQNAVDKRTGLPVFSLYGKTRRPTPEMLSGLDVMLVDLQDIGARSYTYVSCMKLVLESCFEAGVKVMVLDRPNPLGGLKADGPGLDKKWISYVGPFQVPYVHGMTIGELALAATRTPGWLKLSDAGRKNGVLEVVRMRGWRRDMRWRDTGLRWVPTSPRIPHVDSAEGYPMAGLGCQLEDFSHGSNTWYPFRLIRFTGKKPEEVERALRAKKVRGLGLGVVTLRDGTRGVYLSINNWDTIRLTELNFHMMQLSCLWSKKNPFAALPPAKRDLFNKHTGCEAFFQDLCKRGAGVDIASWTSRWTREARDFQNWSRRHWLYA